MRAIEIRPDYDYVYDARLFDERGVLERVAHRFKCARRLGANALKTRALRLGGELDDLLRVSSGTDHSWTRFKRDPGDRTRVLTPPFEHSTDELDRDVLTRLHIVLPSRMTPQPIVHLEKVILGSTTEVKAGPEIVWNIGSSREPMIGINTESGWENVSSDGNGHFLASAARIVHAAHEAFVPVVS